MWCQLNTKTFEEMRITYSHSVLGRLIQRFGHVASYHFISPWCLKTSQTNIFKGKTSQSHFWKYFSRLHQSLVPFQSKELTNTRVANHARMFMGTKRPICRNTLKKTESTFTWRTWSMEQEFMIFGHKVRLLTVLKAILKMISFDDLFGWNYINEEKLAG